MHIYKPKRYSFIHLIYVWLHYFKIVFDIITDTFNSEYSFQFLMKTSILTLF